MYLYKKSFIEFVSIISSCHIIEVQSMLLSAKFEKKFKNARNEKQKKLHGFSFSINMANFEAFPWDKKLSANLTRTYLVPSLNTQIELYG